MRSILWCGLLVVAFLGITPRPAYATDADDNTFGIYNGTTVVDPCTDPTKCNTPDKLIGEIGDLTVKVLIYLAGVAGVIGILYGGMAYVTAGGDDTKAGRAKRILVYGVVTIVVASAVWMFRRATESAVNTLINDQNATVL